MAVWLLSLAATVFAVPTPAVALLFDPPSVAESGLPGQSQVQTESSPRAPVCSPSEVQSEVLAYQPEIESGISTAQLLEDILKSPEFDAEASSNAPGFLDQILAKFQAWLARLFPNLVAGGTAVSIVTLLLITLLGLLLIYLVARITWTLATLRGARKESAGWLDAEPESCEALMAAAAHALGVGDYREALRLRFKALLRRLNLSSAPLMTNRQIARQVSEEAPDVRSDFDQLVGLFDDVWYGSQGCDRQQFDLAASWASGIEQRISAIRQGGEAP